MVLTGSHNWTTSANTKNDENTLIIHDDTAANLFLQYFKATFEMLGGHVTLPANNCVPLYAQDQQTLAPATLQVYPNPANGSVNIGYRLPQTAAVTIIVTNALGQQIAMPLKEMLQSVGTHQLTINIATAGVYNIQFITSNTVINKGIVVVE